MNSDKNQTGSEHADRARAIYSQQDELVGAVARSVSPLVRGLMSVAFFGGFAIGIVVGRMFVD